jgi:two-component system, NarL family, nitrate/nitrite response regulator NarL
VRTRLLLVDDHDWFRRVVVATFNGHGYEVVGEAATAAEAVRAADRLRPELVLLDIALPDGDGFAVADRLAEMQVPPVVVLISSRPSEDYGARIERPSVAGFLCKDDLSPHTLSALLFGRQ